MKKISTFNSIVEPSFIKIKSNIVQIHIIEKLHHTLLAKLMTGGIKMAAGAIRI